ncbi:MAG: Rieske (2Fe-2S) protein [Deltaproteobacteria bacterium]|nr:Rieske (2Fe-2S) protein [Deltaproteobacteria bacterium]
MNEKDWIYVMDERDLPEGSISPVYPKGVNVLLAKVDGKVYALDGKCPHMGCPLFCGTLSGHTITCACHDWRFNVKTGEFIDAIELKLKVYGAKAENGRLFVSLPPMEQS